jgi:hypothetical protein
MLCSIAFRHFFHTMSNKNSDILFQLIKSLQKSEKRHFKLYINRNSQNQDLKTVQLFDVLDKLEEYDEAILLKKTKGITKQQLANLKAHLYKEILSSLRLLRTADNVDLQLSEHLDFARILYNKGLKFQALRLIEKCKELAQAHNKINALAQVLSLEKKIEILHITRSPLERAEILSNESLAISYHIDKVTRLSNLTLQLYRWYVQYGHSRNEEDEKEIKSFFKNNLPPKEFELKSFYEKLYYYQSYSWYGFIRQDFLMYYRYSQKIVELFAEQKSMIVIETGHYIKSVHNLLNSLFDLRHYNLFDKTLISFEGFANTLTASVSDNFYIHTSIYINAAKVNQHLMKGSFAEGIKIIPTLKKQLTEYELFVDRHRIVVFNYKIALLYFGNCQFDLALDYLNTIINNQVDLRYDLQCYARLLHLMAHYELGNDEIIESLIKSVYRFMAKMNNLTVVEVAIFKFLKQNFSVSPRKLQPAFAILLEEIKHLEKNRFETRAFAYLDIISWVESKVYNKTMAEIINQKYISSKRM